MTMRPENPSGKEEFNIDNEIAKLWENLGEDFKNLERSTRQPAAVLSVPNFKKTPTSNKNKQSEVNQKATPKRFNPPTITDSAFPHVSVDRTSIPGKRSEVMAEGYDEPKKSVSVKKEPEMPTELKKAEDLDIPDLRPIEGLRKKILNIEVAKRTMDLNDALAEVRLNSEKPTKTYSLEKLPQTIKNTIENLDLEKKAKRLENKHIGKRALALASAFAILGAGHSYSLTKEQKSNDTEQTTAGESYNVIYDKEMQDKYGSGAEIREYIDDETGERKVMVVIDGERENSNTVSELDTKTSETNQDDNNIEDTTENEEAPLVEDEYVESAAETKIETPSSEITDDMGLEFNLTESMKKQIKTVQEIFKEHKNIYDSISKTVEERTGIKIPAELICAIHFRESGCNFGTYLQNGDPLGKPTTHVPVGLDFDTFEESAVAALVVQLSNYNDYKGANFGNMSTISKFANRYNGTGSKKYFGLESSYVYSGTEKYTGGMYVADGHFDKQAKDERPGVCAIVAGLANVIN